jgi:isopentenyldiphosphate isomerase
MAELIDIVDEDGEPTGKHVEVMYAHVHGTRHRCAHVWVLHNGKILLQKRAEHKRIDPNKYDISASGHIKAGEEPLQAAIRELHEQLSLTITKDDLEFVYTQEANDSRPGYKNNELNFVYITEVNSIDNIKFSDAEVQEITEFTPQELEDALAGREKDFVPHKEYWKSIIEKCKEHLK